MGITLFEIALSASVRWTVRASDPAVLPIELAECKLLNPILLNAFGVRRNSVGGHVVLAESDRVTFATNSILLAFEGLPQNIPFDPNRLSMEIARLFLWVRVKHWQTQIPNSMKLVAIIPHHCDLQMDDLTVSFDPAPTSSGMLQRDLVDTAVSILDLTEISDAIARGDSPPVSERYFADALEFHSSDDFSAALFSSAISVETLAGEHLEKLYQHRLSGGDGPQLRVVKGSVSAADRDPIYEVLMKQTNFRMLLHERPLYLENRSLLVEDKQLYDTLLNLYGARNRIAHTGLVGKNSGQLKSDFNGSTAAISAVHRVHSWFGLPLPALTRLSAHSNNSGIANMVKAEFASLGSLDVVNQYFA